MKPYISPHQKKAKAYAARYGFTCRRVTHSRENPNGYIKVIDPKGKEHRVKDWFDAFELMLLAPKK